MICHGVSVVLSLLRRLAAACAARDSAEATSAAGFAASFTHTCSHAVIQQKFILRDSVLHSIVSSFEASDLTRLARLRCAH